MFWSRESTKRLIELLECNECLWNQKCPDYSKRAIRDAVLHDIATVLVTTTDDVKLKIKGLRSQMSGMFFRVFFLVFFNFFFHSTNTH